MRQLIPAEQKTLLLSPAEILSLKEAEIPGGAFAMRELDREHLETLKGSDPREWPHILVTLCSGGYILIDGYHRFAVAKSHGWQLKATCLAFENEHQIIEAAFRANLKHGLKASLQTRGDYAYWLFLTYPDLSQGEIAERCGLTQGTVSRAIAKREEEAKQAEQESDPQERLRQNCKRFTKVAIRFLGEVEAMSDEEVSDILASVVGRPGDKMKLQRIAKLFESMKQR